MAQINRETSGLCPVCLKAPLAEPSSPPGPRAQEPPSPTTSPLPPPSPTSEVCPPSLRWQGAPEKGVSPPQALPAHRDAGAAHPTTLGLWGSWGVTASWRPRLHGGLSEAPSPRGDTFDILTQPRSWHRPAPREPGERSPLNMATQLPGPILSFSVRSWGWDLPLNPQRLVNSAASGPPAAHPVGCTQLLPALSAGPGEAGLPRWSGCALKVCFNIQFNIKF